MFNANKPASDVFNEALNLARISESGIRTPKPLEVSEVEGTGWALLTEKVPGVTLADKMAAEPSKFYEYLEQFVDLQVEIHANRSPLLNRQRDKYARMINGLPHINATTRYNLMERLDGMKKEFQICHGDFNPSNVIVAEDGQLYVCDWAHATQGSPAADAAMTYLLFALTDKQQADAYLELYCDRADVPMQVVRQWMSIVAAAELSRKRTDVNDEFLQRLDRRCGLPGLKPNHLRIQRQTKGLRACSGTLLPMSMSTEPTQKRHPTSADEVGGYKALVADDASPA